eukprot:jgi/Chrzof1/13066/Cz07g18180.t1
MQRRGYGVHYHSLVSWCTLSRALTKRVICLLAPAGITVRAVYGCIARVPSGALTRAGMRGEAKQTDRRTRQSATYSHRPTLAKLLLASRMPGCPVPAPCALLVTANCH